MDTKFLYQWLSAGALMSVSPRSFLLGWGRCTKKKLLSKNNPCGFYFPDFFLEESEPWLTYEHTLKIDGRVLLDFLVKARLPSEKITWEKPSHSIFSEAFTSFKQEVAKEHLVKVVPYVFEIVKSTMLKRQLVHSLLSACTFSLDYPLFCYGFWNDNEGMLGLTPEILFEINDKIETMACAGTRPLSEVDEINNFKEVKEHGFVVQGIAESLSVFGPVETGELKVVKLPKLAHLITPIRVDLGKCSVRPEFISVARALHPTPALGAYPYVNGKAWLKGYDRKIPRGRFGAPAGYSCLESSRCYVAIRNVQWNKEQMRIGAGCGVIAESQLDNEWSEIELKLQMIKDVLKL